MDTMKAGLPSPSDHMQKKAYMLQKKAYMLGI
jgi:hypothetical protein